MCLAKPLVGLPIWLWTGRLMAPIGTIWGDINLEEAPGSENYFGEIGPDFEGLVVRYLLLSVTSNHGGNCYGFSEVKLDVSSCRGLCTGDIVPNGMH